MLGRVPRLRPGEILWARALGTTKREKEHEADQTELGCALQGALVAALKKYLLETLAVEDVARDMPQTLDEWISTARDACFQIGVGNDRALIWQKQRCDKW